MRDASRERRGGGRGDHLSGPSSARHELVYGRGRRGEDARSGDATARARSVRVRRNGRRCFGNANTTRDGSSLDSAIVSANELRTGATRRFFLNYRGGNRSPDSRPKNTALRIDAGESKWRKREISKEIFLVFRARLPVAKRPRFPRKRPNPYASPVRRFRIRDFRLRDLKTKVETEMQRCVATR